MTVFLDEISERDVNMELVWVRVFPTDLQLLDCLAADLEVLLLEGGEKKASEKLNLVRPVAHQAQYCILPQSGSNALRFPNLKPPDL